MILSTDFWDEWVPATAGMLATFKIFGWPGVVVFAFGIGIACGRRYERQKAAL